jgi:four helix bundle protein
MERGGYMTFSQDVKRKTQDQKTYHQKLSEKIDFFVDRTYAATKCFPAHEAFGATSQLRRAALSVPLNYHEGHGRFSDKSRIQFLRIAFGSLRECLYLIDFAKRQEYIPEERWLELKTHGQEVYAMFWGILKNV